MIDELRPSDYRKIKAYLDEKFGPSDMGQIYWIPLDQNILTDIQAEHSECRPFYFAVDIEPDLLSCELLVRTKNRVRCDCICYATEQQRNWLIGFADGMCETLCIKT